MKIVRFQWRNKVKWGILEDDTIFTLGGQLYGNFEQGEELRQLQDVRLASTSGAQYNGCLRAELPGSRHRDGPDCTLRAGIVLQVSQHRDWSWG